MRELSQLWDSGYTPSVPFKVDLPDGGVIICEEVVRAMPGRRYVCRGTLAGQVVFIKLFAQDSRATREWQNEQRGIHALHKSAIPAPKIINSTSLISPQAHIIVYEELTAAQSARDRWLQSDDIARKQILDDLVALLATHHAAGIRQKDMHFHNFIYSGGVLYTLDAADIDISPTGLLKEDALENLSFMLALADAEHDRWIHDLYRQYIGHCGWQENEADELFVRQKVKQGREYKLRKYLAKIFRNCSAFVSGKSWRKFYIYDRNEDSPEFRKLIADPDHLPETVTRKLIKAGNTCTVTEITMGSNVFVCKRYNIKNIWHAVNRAFRPTRASQSWRNAHRLFMHRVVTAKPVALIERRFGPLRGKAWFIMQAVPGPRLSEYIVDPAVAEQERMKVVGSYIRFLQIMCRERISHGDMKATNFIIRDGEIAVLDLDSLRVHKTDSGFDRAFRRDLRRFLRNWNELPEIERLFREAIASAGLQNYLPGE